MCVDKRHIMGKHIFRIYWQTNCWPHTAMRVSPYRLNKNYTSNARRIVHMHIIGDNRLSHCEMLLSYSSLTIVQRIDCE
uniref:Ovule protein n=1 Tax=Ascaris lumbricoides TaxID=6252 RepID=A0A0M3I5Y8_ASCLU